MLTTDDQKPVADPASAPDWDQLDHDVLCPLCEYNLRALTQARCPECGYRFTWDEVLDPRRRIHPYLFEHHPERNIRSFIRTALGAWLPKRFWTSLHPIQPSQPRRLLLYWFICAGAYLIAVGVLLLAAMVFEMQNDRQQRASAIARAKTAPGQFQQARIRQYGSVEAWFDVAWPAMSWRDAYKRATREDAWRLLGIFVAIPLGWPWVTFAALMIFRISMRRARINPVHVRRCVVYSYDEALWIGILVTAGTGVALALNNTAFRGGIEGPLGFVAMLWSVVVLIAAYRLWRAYVLYLRFDHCFATVLSSQIITGLVMLNVLAFLTIWQN